MARKKEPRSDKVPEDKALEQRVDAMLNPELPDAKISAPPPLAGSEEPIDIFKDTAVNPAELAANRDEAVKTAPELPGSKKKVVTADELPKAVPEPEKTAEPEPAESAEVLPEPGIDEANPALNNAATDKAVDDIASKEDDSTQVASDSIDDKPRSTKPASQTMGWKAKIVRLLKSKRFWAIIIILLAIVLAVPFTRYKLIGLVIKKPVSVSVIDSKTMTPVSNVAVELAGKMAKTDANGKAIIKAGPGNSQLIVDKQYYKQYKKPYFVSLKSSQAKILFVATGRQVPITVVNTITGQPLSEVEIKVLNTSAKTDTKGEATIVLPATSTDGQGTISLKGYNTTKISVDITDQSVKQNSFKLTPAGHIYFLSNANGTIDVVKANLDGSGRNTVLTGTGKEDSSTSLLASRDWRYLVLKARRDTAQPALYLIDTKDDNITPFEQSDASINVIGWSGHNFVYDLTRNTLSNWQASRESVKSYDADNQQPNQLDQNQAAGDASAYAYQSFDNFYILNGLMVYSTQWNSVNGYNITSRNDSIRAIQPAGNGKKDYQTFAASGIGYIQANLYRPQAVYYAVYDDNAGKVSYYSFENQAATSLDGLDPADFNKTYPTYLVSPSSNQTFWSELRNGKNVLFTGNISAENPKQIAGTGDGSPYGWYSDSYTLISKDKNQLYIMPSTGLKGSQQPVKVTDYYKSTPSLRGYGYGYGGL